MRLFSLMICCAVLVTSFADPDPKKYKTTLKKNKPANTTLTAEERDFLREVETKFGIKPEGKNKKGNIEVKLTSGTNNSSGANAASPIDLKLPYPAVIAIEIVNDTDTKSQGKGKRTIDANLGYGYKTNNGYSYTYFGKPTHDHGKFMIYPYSQEDIPPTNSHTSVTNVEITPSRAFELVSEPEKESEGYDYPKPATEFKTTYNDVKGLVSPPASYSSSSNSHVSSHSSIPSTLYTTYNGHELSGLSGQFPSVRPNYFVNPSQLLRNPEYQGVGLTNEHLRPHGSNIGDQRVVPVLVLKIPSSSLNNPTAELFANLPSNYPLSRYLNNVNLQGLVNQYFKKHGYPFAPPQVTHYQHSHETLPEISNVGGNYGRQHYAAPYVQPSYTQSDHSGVQYSAVQPVMARYPSSYTQRFNLPHGHSLYHQPLHEQKYEYRYQYVPQHVQSSHPTAVPQTYYVQPQYQQQTHEAQSVPETGAYNRPAEQSYVQQEHDQEQYDVPQQQIQQTHEQDTSAEVSYEQPQEHAQTHYEAPQQQIQQTNEQDSVSYEYRSQTPETQGHEAAKAAYEYLQHQQQQQEQIESASPSYGHIRQSEVAQHYYTQVVPEQKETEVIFKQQPSQEEHAQSQESDDAQHYHYQQQAENDGDNLVLTENYPSKDHTIATVLPVSYTAKQPNVGALQTVSYVTPMPYSSKYQSPYRIMVPQTFLTNPTTEKVAYVNSHSVSAYAQPQQEDSEVEYTLGPHHIPPVGRQKPSSYPRNYHSYTKRLAKPEKPESTSNMFSRKQSERNEKKKL